VGENPPDNASEIRANFGLYGKDRVEASEGQMRVSQANGVQSTDFSRAFIRSWHGEKARLKSVL